MRSWKSLGAGYFIVIVVAGVSGWIGMGLFAGTPRSSMAEQERFVIENFTVYRTGEGAVLADPIYPNEESEMGVAEIRYRIISPELYDFQERPVPVLRQDALKKGDEVKVESFHNPKAWRQEHVVLARPAQK